MGRGDRRLAAARRAWELGGMDSWFDNLDRALLGGKRLSKPIYLEIPLCRKRRVELNGGSEQENLHQHSLDAPLPWDHIDTGDKCWLADLQLALEAVTVPDCSLSCSECGVCGVDLVIMLS